MVTNKKSNYLNHIINKLRHTSIAIPIILWMFVSKVVVVVLFDGGFIHTVSNSDPFRSPWVVHIWPGVASVKFMQQVLYVPISSKLLAQAEYVLLIIETLGHVSVLRFNLA